MTTAARLFCGEATTVSLIRPILPGQTEMSTETSSATFPTGKTGRFPRTDRTKYQFHRINTQPTEIRFERIERTPFRYYCEHGCRSTPVEQDLEYDPVKEIFCERRGSQSLIRSAMRGGAPEKINVLWFLPTHGDSRYLGTQEGGRSVDLPYLQQVARAADSLGYYGVLLPTGRSCEDSWIVASSLITSS